MSQPSPYFIRRSQPIDTEAIDSSFRENPDEEERSIDFLNYWITIKKHRWMILSIAAAALTIVAIRVSMLTPLYTADATILLRPGNPQLLEGHTGAPGEGASSGDWESVDDFLKTQCEILKSRTLAANVVTSDGLANDPLFTGRSRKPSKGLFSSWFKTKPEPKPAPATADSVDNAINSYLGSLDINPVPDTNLVRIVFTTPSARLSARLANAHAHAYIREGIEFRTQANAEAERFLRDKLVELKEKLEKSELALNNYRRDKGIVPGLMSVDGKETVVIARLSDLSRELTAAQVARIGLEAEVDQIKKNQVPQLPASASGNSAGSYRVVTATRRRDERLRRDGEAIQARLSADGPGQGAHRPASGELRPGGQGLFDGHTHPSTPPRPRRRSCRTRWPDSARKRSASTTLRSDTRSFSARLIPIASCTTACWGE